MEQRRKLGSFQLAKLLQAQIECLKDRKSNTHFSYSIAKWMQLTGTKSTEANFSSEFRKALKRLKEAEFLADYAVTRGKVHLTLPDASGTTRPFVELQAPTTRSREPSVRIDGMRLQLGEEVPSLAEVVGEGKWVNPLPIKVYVEPQLRAMLKLYPKAYGQRPELPAILRRIEAELEKRSGTQGACAVDVSH